MLKYPKSVAERNLDVMQTSYIVYVCIYMRTIYQIKIKKTIQIYIN